MWTPIAKVFKYARMLYNENNDYIINIIFTSNNNENYSDTDNSDNDNIPEHALF